MYDDAWTKRRTPPRAAASRMVVGGRDVGVLIRRRRPVVARSSRGVEHDLAAFDARRATSGSARSPTIGSRPSWCRGAGSSPGRTTDRTSCPARTAASATWLPMNPAAPVTRICMRDLLLLRVGGRAGTVTVGAGRAGDGGLPSAAAMPYPRRDTGCVWDGWQCRSGNPIRHRQPTAQKPHCGAGTHHSESWSSHSNLSESRGVAHYLGHRDGLSAARAASDRHEARRARRPKSVGLADKRHEDMVRRCDSRCDIRWARRQEWRSERGSMIALVLNPSA